MRSFMFWKFAFANEPVKIVYCEYFWMFTKREWKLQNIFTERLNMLCNQSAIVERRGCSYDISRYKICRIIAAIRIPYSIFSTPVRNSELGKVPIVCEWELLCSMYAVTSNSTSTIETTAEPITTVYNFACRQVFQTGLGFAASVQEAEILQPALSDHTNRDVFGGYERL